MQSAATLNGGSYPAGGTGSRARDLGLRAQKKLLGRVVSTGAGRSLLIDDATTSLLDNLYKLMERAAKANPSLDKKQPEKVLKNIVKLSIKVLVSPSMIVDTDTRSRGCLVFFGSNKVKRHFISHVR